MGELKRISFIILGIVLITAQFAPLVTQLMDQQFIEMSCMDETEKEEKTEKESEEKEKFASSGFSSLAYEAALLNGHSPFKFSIPTPPYLETLSPPPDLFL